MRFVRVCRALETGEVLAVIEQGVPFETGGNIEFDGVASETIDLGLCEDFDAADAVTKAAYIRERLEKHPLADQHPDAPKVRFSPHAVDAPTLHFCPTNVTRIIEHVEQRGAAGLPSESRNALRQVFAGREDIPLKVLRAVGFTIEELKRHPRTHANRARIEAEKQAEAERLAAEVQRARLERKLAEKRGEQ